MIKDRTPLIEGKEPGVMLGCPMQNREWILPTWLKKVQELQYPKEKIHLSFLLNACKDKTKEKLLEFKEKHGEEYRKIDIWTAKGNWRDARVPGRHMYYMAELRNTWLTMLEPEDDWLFSVDSDILLHPTHLVDLVTWDLPVCAGLIPNGPIRQGALAGQMAFNFMRKWYYDEPKGFWAYQHAGINWLHYQEHLNEWRPYPPEHYRDRRYMPGMPSIMAAYHRVGPPVKVDMTGAVYVIKREVIESGVKYGFHPQGEDIHFCELSYAKGYPTYIDRMVMPDHIMDPQMLENYEEGMKQKEAYHVIPPVFHRMAPSTIKPVIRVEAKE